MEPSLFHRGKSCSRNDLDKEDIMPNNDYEETIEINFECDDHDDAPEFNLTNFEEENPAEGAEGEEQAQASHVGLGVMGDAQKQDSSSRHISEECSPRKIPEWTGSIPQDVCSFEIPLEIPATEKKTPKEQNLGLSSSPMYEKIYAKDFASRKQRLQAGKMHINSRGKLIEKKEFKNISCQCRMKCYEKLTVSERQILFNRFWSLGNWQTQSLFIVQSVKILPIQRRTTMTHNNRNFSRKFYLNGKNVCKSMFISTLRITNKRLDYALRVKSKGGLISPDKRGGHPPNKTPRSTLDKIEKFLNAFPKFQSHYSLNKRQYFKPGLTIQKLYELYLENLEKNNEQQYKVSYRIFVKCFKSYNVHIYIPKADTCQMCDKLKIQINSAIHKDKLDLINTHEAHLRRAHYAREYLNKKTSDSKKDKTMLCFTFDMQKTQPIPYLNASVAFYKRQLWLLNLGINTRHNNKGYMCLWTEAEGRRGANEICSSIFQFLKSQDLSNINEIVTFSDSCGGQNRNKTMISFMMFALCHFNIDSWEHTYLESGHSFLPNDSDFAKIEKKKNRVERIFSLDEWVQLIKSATRVPYEILRMKGKMLNFKSNLKYLCFRNRNEEGSAFSWLSLKWLKIRKLNGKIQYKTSLEPNVSEHVVNFAPKEGINFQNSLPECCPSVKISFEKFKDLLSLLTYIPQSEHEFFQNLPHETVNRKTKILEDLLDEENSDEE